MQSKEPRAGLDDRIRRLETERDAALEKVRSLEKALMHLTEMTKVHEELIRSRALYRSIASNFPDGAVYVFDQELRFIVAEGRGLAGIGWRRELLEGMSVAELDPETRNIIEPLYRRVLAGESFRLETEYRGHTILSNYLPIRDSKGVIRQGLVVSLDITDRKQAENALRESEMFHRQTLDSIPGMVFTSKPDGYCDYVSHQWSEYTGVPREKLLGNKWLRVLHPEDRVPALGAWQAAVLNGSPYDVEYRVSRSDGNYEWFKVYGHPIRNEADQIVRWLGTALNIHQLILAKEQLGDAKLDAEQANQAKSEFLANMSHEIRTPMTVFMAAIEHLQQVDPDPERRKLLKMAEQSAERLRLLIDDILDFSRLEAKKLEIQEEVFNVRKCVQEATAMFTLPAHKMNLLLEIDVAPDVPENVRGDENRIGQVLINLISNAVKFTEKGKISISVKTHGPLLEFSVADTGIGIPEGKGHLLFRSFTQADGSFTRRFGGTGLGLAISKGLVEKMGGEIAFSSQKDRGSVFTFLLPLKPVDRPSLPSSVAHGETPVIEPTAKRILLVEDEQMIRDMIVLSLGQKGYEIEVAETGQAALEKWKIDRYDMILMDLQMPEMSGLEATRRIRENEEKGKARTCIVGLTAHARPEIKDACLAAGMNKVLHKPVRMQELFETIERCSDRAASHVKKF